MKQYDIIIIGGGPAGVFAAIMLLQKNSNTKILILEKESEPLKKLLTSGSGACNFTHSGTVDDFLLKYGSNGQFLRNAFYNYFVDDFVSFLESNGLKTICREDGKYFPSSMNAKDIKKLFLNEINSATLVCNESVIDITNNDGRYHVTTAHSVYSAPSVLITTGGKSFPKTGSTGDGYQFATSFGHTIIPPKPSLASVYCKHHVLSDCSGISFNEAKIMLSKKKSFTGPLLITHKGFSGPVIIDNSRDFCNGDTFTLSFISEKREKLESYFKEAKTETVSNALKKYDIPKKMIQYFCESISIDSQKKLGEISHKLITSLIDLVIAFPVQISHVEGFETCMCTSGGVNLKEVNPKTFESKLASGLYFLGEVLDIDGDSGGYNLQAIWSECALFAENF